LSGKFLPKKKKHQLNTEFEYEISMGQKLPAQMSPSLHLRGKFVAKFAKEKRTAMSKRQMATSLEHSNKRPHHYEWHRRIAT